MTAPTTRTDGIDFAAILAHCRDAMHDAMEFPSYIDVDVLLAAKVPEACPESGSHDGHNPPVLGCGQCPTIGQMLREHQALTAIAERAWHSPACPKSAYEGRLLPCTCGLDAARAALQAVRS